MHVKSELVTRFLEAGLLAIIGEAFGEVLPIHAVRLRAMDGRARDV
jgi:hypothetical protein